MTDADRDWQVGDRVEIVSEIEGGSDDTPIGTRGRVHAIWPEGETLCVILDGYADDNNEYWTDGSNLRRIDDPPA